MAEAAGNRRVLIADPVSQFLASHDREIARRLAARGHRVTLATTEGYPFDSRGELFEQMPLYRNVGGGGSFASKGFNYVQSLLRLLRLARRERVDTVILYYHLLPLVDALWVQTMRALGFRVVVCVHDVLPIGRTQDTFGIRRRLYRAASELVTFSTYAKHRLSQLIGVDGPRIRSLSFGPPQEAVSQCPNARAATAECSNATQVRTSARERVGWPSDEKTFLCFGQIKSNKGLDYLLPAFARIAAQEPLARLRVMGRPWRVDLEPFRLMAQQLGLDGRVEFSPEFVPEARVGDCMAAADAVVLPYTALYQSAVLPLACMLCKPVVATRVGSIPEVLGDGETGYLVPPCDTEALAAALAAVLNDPAEAQRRGCRAHRAAQRKYSWDALAAGLGAIVEECEPSAAGLAAGEDYEY